MSHYLCLLATSPGSGVGGEVCTGKWYGRSSLKDRTKNEGEGYLFDTITCTVLCDYYNRHSRWLLLTVASEVWRGWVAYNVT